MTKKDPPLTYRRLCDLLNYDRRTGVFTWRLRRGRTAKAGDEAGTIDKNGHVMIGIDGDMYPAGRLAWLYVTKDWPPGRVSFLDGNPSNTAFLNLRTGPVYRSKSPTAVYQRTLRELNVLAMKAIKDSPQLSEEYTAADSLRAKRLLAEVRDSIRINGQWRD